MAEMREESGATYHTATGKVVAHSAVNDVGCDRWMLLAETNEAGEVLAVETVKLAAGVTFHSGEERVIWKILAVGGATEIHERYAKMELTRV